MSADLQDVVDAIKALQDSIDRLVLPRYDTVDEAKTQPEMCRSDCGRPIHTGFCRDQRP